MNFKLNTDQAKMVEENMNLVPFVVKKMRVPLEHYEDAISEGNLGLVQAVYYFNKHLGYRFSTFAYRVIRNHLNNYFFPTIFPKSKVIISLSTPLSNEEDKTSIEDLLMDETVNFEKVIEFRNSFQILLNKAINCLSGRIRATFLYKLAGCTDATIAKHFQRSTARIFDFRQMAFKSLKEIYDDNKEVFHMEIQEKNYKLTFATKDIAKFNQVFAKFLYDIQNEEKIHNLPSFRLNCTKEQILLTLPAEPSSFVLIGLLMEHIETFAMQHIAEFRPSLPEKILENSSNVLPSPSIVSTPSATKVSTSISARKEKLDEIRKYMQNQDSFRIKDLTKQFADIPYHSITDLIGREKKNGKLYMIAKGTYSKNPPENSSENSFENSSETPSVNSSRNLSRNLRNDSYTSVTDHSVDAYHNNTNISKKKKIREYILTLENFTSSEIQKHFSDVHYQSIILVIRQMKKENLIKSTSYGNYKVIAS